MNSIENDFFSPRGSTLSNSSYGSDGSYFDVPTLEERTLNSYYDGDSNTEFEVESKSDETDTENNNNNINNNTIPSTDVNNTNAESSMEDYFAKYPQSMGCVSMADLIEAVKTAKLINERKENDLSHRLQFQPLP